MASRALRDFFMRAPQDCDRPSPDFETLAAKDPDKTLAALRAARWDLVAIKVPGV